VCNFTITFTGSAADFVTKIQTKITGAGGTFTGDTNGGSFSAPTPVGKIAGTYTINGQNAAININKKPIFVSCGSIEDYINNAL
jgi:hypothetical protein